MLDTHNAAKAESKGLEIMKAANNTMTAIAVQSEVALRLDGARLAILALGPIEDHRMSMELGSNVSIHRTCRIVFEFGGNEFARSFRWMVPADAGLRIVLELFKGCADAFAVRLTHPVVTADKSCQRNGLWSGKGRVPSGPMLH